MRLIESAAPDGPLVTVVPSCLHGRVSSPHREETPTEGFLDPGLSIVRRKTNHDAFGWCPCLEEKCPGQNCHGEHSSTIQAVCVNWFTALVDADWSGSE